MEKTIHTSNYGEVKLSGSETDILDLIGKIRNDLIRDFLDERFLREYFQNNYHISDLSNLKVEFIRKELKELYASPISIGHYRLLLEEIQNNDQISILEENEQLFYKDIESIFHKYF